MGTGGPRLLLRGHGGLVSPGEREARYKEGWGNRKHPWNIPEFSLGSDLSRDGAKNSLSIALVRH